MSDARNYVRWSISDDDLDDLSPETARDLIVKCFAEAQKETFVRARHNLGSHMSDDQLYQNLVSTVRLTFRDVGGDFKTPTKASLAQVVAALASKSKAFGTPDDIIDHHRIQIERVLSLL